MPVRLLLYAGVVSQLQLQLCSIDVCSKGSAALPQLLYVGTALTCMSRFPASAIEREKLNGTCILPSTDQDTWEERTPVATVRDVFPEKEDTSHVVEPVSCPLPLY